MLNDRQMYFKVINSGTNQKLVYDFVLVVYTNFCRITHCFWEIWCESLQWPWNMRKVIDTCIIRKLLWATYVICPKDSVRMNSPSPFSTTPLSFDAPFPANACKYLYKPYTVRDYVPWATFLSLTVYGYLWKISNSFVRKLEKLNH